MSGPSLVEQVMDLPLWQRSDFLQGNPRAQAELEARAGTPYWIYSDSPVEFVRRVFGETTWTKQNEIMRSAWDHERTVVAAAHSPGKTFIAARIAAWWVATHPYGSAQVVTTAPTWRQVKNLLWPHIKRLQVNNGLPGKIGQNAEWRIGDDLVAFGFSPSDHDEAAAQGIHAPYPMVIVDEAGGISRTRFQALEGIMSSGFARMVAIGNPATNDENTAFQERYNMPNWHDIRISAFDTPNFTGEETGQCSCVVARWRPHPVAEHLTQPKWVEEITEEFGVDSAYYVARVLAQFPRGLADRAIPWSFIEAALEREVPSVVSSQAALGVDIASDGGDELAFALNDGFRVRVLEGRAGAANADALHVAHRVRQHVEGGSEVGHDGLLAVQHRRDPYTRAKVRIDAIGLGWGVHSTVKAWASEFMWPVDVIAVQVGERPDTSKGQGKYLNKRAEMWWQARDLLKDVVVLDVDKWTAAQLAGPLYEPTSAGLTKIESKDSMRRRGLRSPDRAEAVLLSLYTGQDAGPASASADLVDMRLPSPRDMFR